MSIKPSFAIVVTIDNIELRPCAPLRRPGSDCAVPKGIAVIAYFSAHTVVSFLISAPSEHGKACVGILAVLRMTMAANAGPRILDRHIAYCWE
jgi:hypothetical protein